jgi:hypothetical protein
MLSVLLPPVARGVVAALLGSAAWLASADGRADEPAVTIRELDPKTGAAVTPEAKSITYLNVGPLLSLVDASNFPIDYAVGLEGSLNHYGSPRVVGFGYGAFVQAQLVDAKYFRGALGVQGNAGPAGLELGLGLRQGDGSAATTVSFHGGIFLSAGYLVLSFRASPELFAFASGQGGFGFETALGIAIKVPIAVQGRDPTGLAIQAAPASW